MTLFQITIVVVANILGHATLRTKLTYGVAQLISSSSVVANTSGARIAIAGVLAIAAI